MTTVIAVYTSDGCVGRCDAKCHDATCAACDCVCGGRLHGVGRDNAISKNTDDFQAKLTALDWAKAHGVEIKPSDVRTRAPQLVEPARPVENLALFEGVL